MRNLSQAGKLCIRLHSPHMHCMQAVEGYLFLNLGRQQDIVVQEEENQEACVEKRHMDLE